MRGGRRTKFARSLRRDSTEAERKLRARLRDRQLDGLKFKRQAAVGRFVADFLCAEHHLIVELDGEQHGFEGEARRDADRTAQLEAMGYVVMRFWNIDVLRNMDGALTTILDQRHRLETPHPDPLPSGERGRGGNGGPDTGPSMQTAKRETNTPTSLRPGGERARVRGDGPGRGDEADA